MCVDYAPKKTVDSAVNSNRQFGPHVKKLAFFQLHDDTPSAACIFRVIFCFTVT